MTTKSTMRFAVCEVGDVVVVNDSSNKGLRGRVIETGEECLTVVGTNDSVHVAAEVGTEESPRSGARLFWLLGAMLSNPHQSGVMFPCPSVNGIVVQGESLRYVQDGYPRTERLQTAVRITVHRNGVQVFPPQEAVPASA